MRELSAIALGDWFARGNEQRFGARGNAEGRNARAPDSLGANKSLERSVRINGVIGIPPFYANGRSARAFDE